MHDKIYNLACKLKLRGLEDIPKDELTIGLLKITKYFERTTHYNNNEVLYRLDSVFDGMMVPIFGTKMHITTSALEELSGKEYATMNMSEKTTTRYKWLMSVIERE